jgi:hypothetical protein
MNKRIPKTTLTQKAIFHYPLFNLIVKNLIMKDMVFLKTKIYCNVKSCENTPMGEKYGTTTSHNLEKVIEPLNSIFENWRTSVSSINKVHMWKITTFQRSLLGR